MKLCTGCGLTVIDEKQHRKWCSRGLIIQVRPARIPDPKPEPRLVFIWCSVCGDRIVSTDEDRVLARADAAGWEYFTTGNVCGECVKKFS